MRLHPIAWLFILVAAFKVAALSIDLAGLGTATLAAPGPFTSAELNPLGAALEPLAWVIRELAQAASMAAWGLAIEALSRIYRRLAAINDRHAKGELGV
jgi:hypothetical protein